MDERFRNLRRAMHRNEKEKTRFRSLFANACVATDLFNKSRMRAFFERWERKFGGSKTGNLHNKESLNSTDKNGGDDTLEWNRCATLVIEDLMRALNISHTKKHFQVFANGMQDCFTKASWPLDALGQKGTLQSTGMSKR